MSRIELRRVVKRAGSDTLLDGVDLVVAEGEVVSLVGTSGSGKTTILRLIAGLDAPTTGTVTIGGEPVDVAHPGRNRVGMVFQEDALYDHLDVGGNVTFSIRIAGAGRQLADRTGRRRVRRMGIRGLWQRRTRTLSGGERGVVAVGRAIAREGARVLLLDEPLARADQRLRERFRNEIRRLHADTGVTMVIATNDPHEAMAVADRVAVLDRGRILQVAPPHELYRHPATSTVASLVGSPPMNLIPALVQRDDAGWLLAVGTDRIRPRLDLPPGMSGRRVLLGLHPSEMHEAAPGTPFERVLHATAGLVEPLGPRSIIRFGLGTVPSAAFAMFAAAERDRGSRLEITWDPGRLRVFDADSGAAIVS